MGYGADDFISITEDELPMALRAQVSGKVGVFSEGTVSGNHIISITPDFQRALGYARDYQLKGEDYAELGRGKQEHQVFLSDTKTKVFGNVNEPKLLS